MNHKDKNKGTRRQKTGALLVIQKNAIYTCLLGKQRGQGNRGEKTAPCALSAVLVQPPSISRRDFGAGPGPPP